MEDFVEKKDWNGIEDFGYDLAEKSAGCEIADEINEIDLEDYQNELESGLRKAIIEAKKRKAPAIYYEYNMDNSWQSEFFICPEYELMEKYETDDGKIAFETPENEEWACDFYEEPMILGPELEEFSEYYEGFDSTEEMIGITIFLVARTVSSFGKAYEKAKNINDKIAICMAFHDQDAIVRIYEPREN